MNVEKFRHFVWKQRMTVKVTRLESKGYDVLWEQRGNFEYISAYNEKTGDGLNVGSFTHRENLAA